MDYLDKIGLQALWDKIKTLIPKKASDLANDIYIYGVSSTPAATVQKEVSIPSITTLNVGQIIVVKPTKSSAVANGTLKLNDFDAYPMRYNNTAITTVTDSIVWNASYPSIFVFDGSYWVFAGHGYDAGYNAMSQAEATAGTSTTNRVISAKVLNNTIDGKLPQKVSQLENDSGFLTGDDVQRFFVGTNPISETQDISGSKEGDIYFKTV